MSINDQQFEAILLRLESGESMASIQADFPHLEEDIAALQDLQDFFAAQRLQAKPDPQGLKSVLRQVELLNEAGDDERTWGSFFTPWTPSLSIALPAVMVLGVSSYLWQSPLPEAPEPVAQTFETAEFAMAEPMVLSRAMADDMEAPALLMMAKTEVVADMDMAALVESISDEFASDIADFETTRESFEPLFSEPLFSADNLNTL